MNYNVILIGDPDKVISELENSTHPKPEELAAGLINAMRRIEALEVELRTTKEYLNARPQ